MPYRYEQLAGFITELVDAGTLAPGERVPSVRQISQQRRVSLSTALQAYRLLEDRGVLEARPQSGFYVAATFARPPPTLSAPPNAVRRVEISALVAELLEFASHPDYLPLGCAVPSPQLLKAGRLDRFLARAARTKGEIYNIYAPPNGDLGLRQEIARRALQWGQGVAPEEIVVTCGCTEALTLALCAVTQPGDTVAIESPTYFGLLQILDVLGLQALELPTDAQAGISIETLQAALASTSVQACLLSSSFSNPLGCTMPEDRKHAVLELLDAHGIALIEDDIYGDIFFSAERPKPFRALRADSNTIYCSSFSKTLAPGYRIGWLSAPQGHRDKILKRKIAYTLCGPVLPQVALAEYLRSGGYDNHLRRIRRVFAENIARMSRAIDRSFPPGTRVSQPAGGFVLWLELPAQVNTRLLFNVALREGICFAPGNAFSAGDSYANYMRLSCGSVWDARLEAGVKRLGELAQAQIQE